MGDTLVLWLCKVPCTTWQTAYGILHQLRLAMGEREDAFCLRGQTELEDACAGDCKQARFDCRVPSSGNEAQIAKTR